jgi:hypothetical protein
MSFPTSNLLIVNRLLTRIYATVNAVRGPEVGKLFAATICCAQLYTPLVVSTTVFKIYLTLGIGGHCFSQTQCIIFLIKQNGLSKPESTQ